MRALGSVVPLVASLWSWVPSFRDATAARPPVWAAPATQASGEVRTPVRVSTFGRHLGPQYRRAELAHLRDGCHQMRDDALGEAHVPVRDIPGEAHEVSARNLYGFTDRPGSESAADHVQVMQRAHPVGFDNVGDLGRLVQATARDVSPMTIERWLRDVGQLGHPIEGDLVVPTIG